MQYDWFFLLRNVLVAWRRLWSKTPAVLPLNNTRRDLTCISNGVKAGRINVCIQGLEAVVGRDEASLKQMRYALRDLYWYDQGQGYLFSSKLEPLLNLINVSVGVVTVQQLYNVLTSVDNTVKTGYYPFWEDIHPTVKDAMYRALHQRDILHPRYLLPD